MAKDGDWHFWWIYLTHWTLLLQCTYLGFAVFTTWRVYSQTLRMEPQEANDSSEPETSPWWVTATWLLHDVAFPGAFVVTLTYWLLVFEPPLESALSPLTHGLTFVVMLADMVLSNMPLHLMHAVYFVAYGLVYIFFTIMFAVGDGTTQNDSDFVYEVLDWKSEPGTAAVYCAAIAFVLSPLSSLLLWSCTYARTEKAGSRSNTVRSSSAFSRPQVDSATNANNL